MEHYFDKLELCCGVYPRYHYPPDGSHLECPECGNRTNTCYDNISANKTWNKLRREQIIVQKLSTHEDN